MMEMDVQLATQTAAERKATRVLFVTTALGAATGAAILVMSALVAADHQSIAGSVIGASVAGAIMLLTSLCGLWGAKRERSGQNGRTHLLVVRARPPPPASARGARGAAAALTRGHHSTFTPAFSRWRLSCSSPSARWSSGWVTAPSTAAHPPTPSPAPQDTFEHYVRTHWDSMQSDFPELSDMNRTEAIDRAEELVGRNFTVIGAVGLASMICLSSGLWASATILTWPVVMRDVLKVVRAGRRRHAVAAGSRPASHPVPVGGRR